MSNSVINALEQCVDDFDSRHRHIDLLGSADQVTDNGLDLNWSTSSHILQSAWEERWWNAILGELKYSLNMLARQPLARAQNFLGHLPDFGHDLARKTLGTRL